MFIITNRENWKKKPCSILQYNVKGQAAVLWIMAHVQYKRNWAFLIFYSIEAYVKYDAAFTKYSKYKEYNFS